MKHIVRLAWVLWLLGIIGIIALTVSASHAASMSMRDLQGTAVTITDEPCEQVQGWLKMKRATMRYQGRDYAACWTFVGPLVLVFDDDGDVTPIQAERFHKDEAL